MAVNWLGAVGSLLGSVGQGLFSSHSASKAYARQKELWTYMQSNAHQLEVQDLKNAGLNPILSATNSQLAGMPSVSQERVPDNDIGMVITSAVQAGLQDKGLNQSYDIELKKLANKSRELDILEQQSAAQIANLEAQRNEVLEKIKGIVIENKWKDKIENANFNQLDALSRKFFAEASKAVNESSLVSLQKEKLESQLKYGEIFCKYLPPRVAGKVIANIDSIVDRIDFNQLFKEKVAEGKDIKAAAVDYLEELYKKGVLID